MPLAQLLRRHVEPPRMGVVHLQRPMTLVAYCGRALRTPAELPRVEVPDTALCPDCLRAQRR